MPRRALGSFPRTRTRAKSHLVDLGCFNAPKGIRFFSTLGKEIPELFAQVPSFQCPEGH